MYFWRMNIVSKLNYEGQWCNRMWLDIVSQMLLWWTKKSSHSINIGGIVANVVPVYSAYQALEHVSWNEEFWIELNLIQSTRWTLSSQFDRGYGRTALGIFMWNCMAVITSGALILTITVPRIFPAINVQKHQCKGDKRGTFNNHIFLPPPKRGYLEKTRWLLNLATCAKRRRPPLSKIIKSWTLRGDVTRSLMRC